MIRILICQEGASYWPDRVLTDVPPHYRFALLHEAQPAADTASVNDALSAHDRPVSASSYQRAAPSGIITRINNHPHSPPHLHMNHR